MGDFVKVAESAGFELGMVKQAEVGGRPIAVANVDGCFYAIDSTCTHRGGPLAEGALSGKVLTCPWHGGQFNVTTGDVLRFPPRQAVRAYAVEIEGGDILIEGPEGQRQFIKFVDS
jgi:nitrite reductase (NADH) small subunit